MLTIITIFHKWAVYCLCKCVHKWAVWHRRNLSDTESVLYVEECTYRGYL